jgi:hypothetical protein
VATGWDGSGASVTNGRLVGRSGWRDKVFVL